MEPVFNHPGRTDVAKPAVFDGFPLNSPGGCHDELKPPATVGVCDKSGGAASMHRAAEKTGTGWARQNADGTLMAPLIAQARHRSLHGRTLAMGFIADVRAMSDGSPGRVSV